MIEFKWLHLIFLLPLPLVISLLIYIKRLLVNNLNNSDHALLKTNHGLQIPFYHDLIKITANSTGNKKFQSLKILNLFTLLKALLWFSLVLAVMRPVWLDEPIALPTPTHDIIMAIDISGSMQAHDMSGRYQITRLDVVKQIGHQFIEQRKQDRIGLVFFGSSAFVSSPLTLDQESLHNFLEKTQIGFAGQKTAIGDALGLAIKKLESAKTNKNNNGFIILLSDGSNNSGKVDPIEAAKIATKHHIKIYTIGIGKSSNDPVDLITGMALDEKTLKEIAKLTDGIYFHATSKQALASIYNQINSLEPNNEDNKTLRPETEWFIYPLLVTLFCCILLFILRKINRSNYT